MPGWNDDALLALLRLLKEREYRFHAVTPATHARVLARGGAGSGDLRDVFGWNRPFAREALDKPVAALMEQAGILEPAAGQLRSALRVASLDGELFLHSAYPTDSADAVFFGPDTYRFVRFVRANWPRHPIGRAIDMGAGSGAGGILVALAAPEASVVLVDSNPQALALAQVNARAAGVTVTAERNERVPAGADLVIANPPYMMDESGRAYRHGGELLGGAISLEWTEQALAGLAPGGTMLLYTGASVAKGTAPLIDALHRACATAGAALTVEELDPDVFGEELEKPAYREVERIAAIGAVIRLPA